MDDLLNLPFLVHSTLVLVINILPICKEEFILNSSSEVAVNQTRRDSLGAPGFFV